MIRIQSIIAMLLCAMSGVAQMIHTAPMPAHVTQRDATLDSLYQLAAPECTIPAPDAADTLQSVTDHMLRPDSPIMGQSMLSAEQLHEFISSKNPGLDPSLARLYLQIGELYGIRGDVAMCQAALETGWFNFADGTAVKPEQHNFCGLGVTRLGETGARFADAAQGITAQIQHLYAYACLMPLPEGESLLDPRFHLVTRGVAPTWQGLSGRWAANPEYAARIFRIYKSIICAAPTNSRE